MYSAVTTVPSADTSCSVPIHPPTGLWSRAKNPSIAWTTWGVDTLSASQSEFIHPDKETVFYRACSLAAVVHRAGLEVHRAGQENRKGKVRSLHWGQERCDGLER